jgi:hypothetical protein
MKFMVIVKASAHSETGAMPSERLFEDMGRFNEALVRAGVLLSADGLHPSSKGARIRYDGKQRTVIDGPFAETRELVAGFWIIEVGSLQEAIEWMKRAPNPHEDGESEVEIRQIFEMADFGDALPPGVRDLEASQRVRIDARNDARNDARDGRDGRS